MTNNAQASSAFPNITLPDTEKNEAWHKQAVEAITNRSLNQTYTLNYVMMNESVNFFQSLHSGDEYKFLQTAQDGSALPAKWMNLNRIRPKLSIVIGEFMEKGYDIRVKALNPEAVSKKLEEKERMRVKIRLRPDMEMLEQDFGIPLMDNEPLPEDEADLDDFVESTYKETSEFVLESALKWLSRMHMWEYTRMQMFADMLMMGRCFAKVHIVDGLPVIERKDPRLMIFDTNAKDDFLSDATYFGEVNYMGLAEVIEKYNLSQKEIDELKTAQKDPGLTQLSSSVNRDFLITKDNQILYFKQEAGELRVMVVTAYWADTKEWNHRVEKTPFGDEVITPVDAKAKGKNIEKRRIKIWRKGTLIGGKLLKDWGENENQPRSLQNVTDTLPPYIACLPFYLNGTAVSTVQLLKPLQDLKDIIMYRVQLTMAQAGAKGFMYDVSQVPEGMDVEQVIKYARVFGIGLIDSKKDGIPTNFNQFQTFDMSISESVNQYINIMAMVDAEMDAISGINEARQGMTQGASQAVGVTQSMLFQSSLATAPLFRLFRLFASKCFNYQAALVKIAWAGKERFAPIVGDTGVDFLTQDIDLDLNDYGVFVEEVPPLLDDINSFREFLMAAIQSGSLDFVEGMKLMLEKDVKVAVRRFERVMRKKEQEAILQEQMLQQQQAQQQAQLQQMQIEAEDRAQQRDLEKEQMRGEATRKNTLTKGKIDLGLKQLDLFK